jgi:hypothetical protein
LALSSVSRGSVRATASPIRDRRLGRLMRGSFAIRTEGVFRVDGHGEGNSTRPP